MLKTIGVGLCAASLSMNNPAGHQILHEIGLRFAFAEAIEFAEDMSGHEMSFEEFRVFAPFYLQEYYGDDRQSWESAINLLSLSLCLPRPDNPDEPENPDQNYTMACHMSSRKEEEDGDELKPEPIGT